MSLSTTTGTFTPIAGMEARMFGQDMITAGSSAAKLALREVRHLMALDDASQQLLNPAAMVKAALSAGALIGKSGYVDALAVLSATGLDDYEREATGFAMHALAKRKEQGASAVELRQQVNTELAQYAERGGAETVQLAVAAFAVGATVEDAASANELQAVLSHMVVEQTVV